MNDRILLSPPDTGPAEEEAVLRALRGGWVAPLGPEVDAFEEEIAAYTGRKHAVALSSGTAALHLGLLNFGVGPGDVVVTATMTFAATANAIIYTGAEPVFVDCDETGNIDVDLLDHAISDLQAKGRRVAAIVPVDLLGKVANYEGIVEIAARAGVPVLSDAAESLGAWRNGRPAGSFGDASILSFNGNKVMTTSGGGMLLTDDADIASRTRYLATQARQPVIHYEHLDVGYNYRLSNILAALGRAQLARLDSMIERRRQHRLWYRELTDKIPNSRVFGIPDGSEGGDTRDNFWLTSIILTPPDGSATAGLIAHLAKHGIEARPLWKPMHLQPAFSHAHSYRTGMAESLFQTGVSLPSGSAMTTDHTSRIEAALSAYSKQSRWLDHVQA
ncbi:dTDP-4-amino-4,6-dideoxygalactose transaminase [Georgenia satyanarayanai]|uniref:dTDP-4-amino-4,6-dideoxygalactose transaminase n=1 Tax=Georgenia satyanarayanai TaxID=860221 RepID=A0A2Y9C7D6_9MICO|nr:aminotransferase class I/II-fold pyridoxal phosphate-dependent enzyme [Georgenia satyanarayanai]PYF98338.1 dTDP-4-amino-4,6-dideoxygalactose transaminase [Georgenia satyanarayanai]SSA45223.1 dTDP-4-amino-4,6-dideoxygalactose transaminase [Georgenia satyanarayanai]